jgi:hypothetical protein
MQSTFDRVITLGGICGIVGIWALLAWAYRCG